MNQEMPIQWQRNLDPPYRFSANPDGSINIVDHQKNMIEVPDLIQFMSELIKWSESNHPLIA